jgi:hypothetical protein
MVDRRRAHLELPMGFFAFEVGAISSGSNLAPVTVRLDN